MRAHQLSLAGARAAPSRSMAMCMCADPNIQNVDRLNALYSGPSASGEEPTPLWSSLVGWSGNLPDFDLGIRAMRGGEYKRATELFKSAAAAAPGGSTRRLGGHYSVWLAQALHASGREADAIALLGRCEAHADADVRRIATDVRTIFEAPRLELDESSFIKIPPMAPQDGWSRPAFEGRNSREPKALSLEWYEKQASSKLRRPATDQRGEDCGPRPRSAATNLAILFFVLVVLDPVVWFAVLGQQQG